MGGADTKKIYEEFQKQYSLPEFKILDLELEVSSMDASKFLLRMIRGKIRSRLENYCDVIEDILNPDATISRLHECSYFHDTTKKRMFNLYKKMMHWMRLAEYLDLEKSTEKDAKFIAKFFENIEYIKREMKRIMKQRMNTWNKDISPSIKEEYFG
jgi:siroheme synthase (precorrin-2 oxidase/ferrochelatase)